MTSPITTKSKSVTEQEVAVTGNNVISLTSEMTEGENAASTVIILRLFTGADGRCASTELSQSDVAALHAMLRRYLPPATRG